VEAITAVAAQGSSTAGRMGSSAERGIMAVDKNRQIVGKDIKFNRFNIVIIN
jgi:hypothetical protein